MSSRHERWKGPETELVRARGIPDVQMITPTVCVMELTLCAK